jgi:hypothetical protein
MAFGTVMLLFFAGSIAAARVMSASEAVIGVWFLGGMILSLYSAMGVFAPEQANGTLVFLASKPLAARNVFLCKWFLGWLNVIVPMAACRLLVLLIEGRNLDFPKDVVTVPLLAVSMATMFYTMTCCLAPRRATEAQVGFFGLMVLLAGLLHIMLFVWAFKGSIMNGHHLSPSAKIVESLNPLSLGMAQNWPDRLAVIVPVQLAVFALVMWFGLRKWQRSI